MSDTAHIDAKRYRPDDMEIAPDDNQLVRYRDAVTDAVLWLEGFTQNNGKYSGDLNSLRRVQEWLKSEKMCRDVKNRKVT